MNCATENDLVILFLFLVLSQAISLYYIGEMLRLYRRNRKEPS